MLVVGEPTEQGRLAKRQLLEVLGARSQTNTTGWLSDWLASSQPDSLQDRLRPTHQLLLRESNPRQLCV